MNSQVLYSFASVIIVSLISLTGVAVLVFNKKFLNRITLFLVSLAAGTLIGDAFIHIIPEVYSETNLSIDPSIIFLFGILFFFFMEKVLHWHHCHRADYDEHDSEHINPLAITNLVADGLHNLIDGLVIGASYFISTEIGIATTIAVILHEIPQEIGDFGILVHSGMSRLKAISFNFISALFAIVGVVLSIILGDSSGEISTLLLAFAGGGFIYISLGDLIPELKHEENLKNSILQILVFVIGIFLMYLLTFLE